MSYNSAYDLLGKKVSDTYHWLLQSGSDGIIYDGDGNSVTINATIPDIYVLTSSFNSFTSSYSTGSFAGSFTGSLLGTSSWATNAVTSSYALNGGVTKITAGTGINISPTTGLGNVTINSTAASYNTATGSYGSFFDTGSYLATSTTAIYSMSLNTTDISNGVYIDPTDNTKIRFTNAGVYNVQFSAQFSNSDNVGVDTTIWVRKNDVGSVNDIPDTAGVTSVPPFKAGKNGQIISGWNYYITVAANDYIQLLWTVDVANKITLETLPAGVTPTHPRVPSLILTAQRVDTFLSNTGSFSGSFTGNFTGSLLGTASNADTLDGLNSTQFARVDINNTFDGVNTTTQKTLRTDGSYYIAETLYASPTIAGPDTQSIELFNVYDYVTYSTDRPIANTAAIFNYTILDPSTVSIRSGQINLSWSPGTLGQEAITETQTIVNLGENSKITFDYVIDYPPGAEYVKLRVLNGATTDIYIRGFLRII